MAKTLLFFFSLSPAVGGVAVRGFNVGVGLRRVQGHVILQHTTTTTAVHVTPGAAGRC